MIVESLIVELSQTSSFDCCVCELGGALTEDLMLFSLFGGRGRGQEIIDGRGGRGGGFFACTAEPSGSGGGGGTTILVFRKGSGLEKLELPLLEGGEVLGRGGGGGSKVGFLIDN